MSITNEQVAVQISEEIKKLIEGDNRITRFDYPKLEFPDVNKRPAVTVIQDSQDFIITLNFSGIDWPHGLNASAKLDARKLVEVLLPFSHGHVNDLGDFKRSSLTFRCKRDNPEELKKLIADLRQVASENRFVDRDPVVSRLQKHLHNKPRHVDGDVFYVGVDLGGTGMDVCLFKLNKDGSRSKKPIDVIELKTKKPLAELSEQLAEAVATLNNRCLGRIAGVGVGMPGRFDENGNIMKGSCPQLGEPIGEEFDGKNPQKVFQAALNKAGVRAKVFAGNDADAMFFGAAKAIASGKLKGLVDQRGSELTPDQLMNSIFAGLGIGTGLGNSYLKFNDNGEVERVNDGHASKFKLKIDAADKGRILKAARLVEDYNAAVDDNKKLPRFELFDGNKSVKSENLISGPGIAALAGLTDAKQLSLQVPEHKSAIDLSAKYTARLIQAVYERESVDINKQDWTPAQKDAASETSIYIIGGGFGTSPEGEYFAKQLSQELRKIPAGERSNLNEFVKVVRLTGDSAALAAEASASFIPDGVLAEAQQKAAAAGKAAAGR